MADQQGGLMGLLMPLVLFAVIFYFLIVRPQKKKQKQHDEMIGSIARGDQVITAGGFFGTVREVKDDSFILEIADGVKARILKSSISVKRSIEENKPAKKKESDISTQEEKAAE